MLLTRVSVKKNILTQRWYRKDGSRMTWKEEGGCYFSMLRLGEGSYKIEACGDTQAGGTGCSERWNTKTEAQDETRCLTLDLARRPGQLVSGESCPDKPAEFSPGSQKSNACHIAFGWVTGSF